MSWLKGVVKDLTKGKAGSGPLTGKTVKVQSYLVKVENVLGEGGFATIYRCSDNTTKAAFALKHFRLSGHPEAVQDVQMEVGVMRALRDNPHALHLRAVAFSGPPGAEDEAFMLLDLCKDNLASHLAGRGPAGLGEAELLRAFLPVCRAVQAMHSLDPPLAHRDLKAENVLLHTNDQWVLCDFGSATNLQQVYSNPQEIAIEEENIRKHTTPAYRAPEMWDLYAREFIGLKVDIWALGCLLYLLCYGRLPFDGDAKLQILNGRYTLPPSRPEPLRALIKEMLVVDSSKRLGIDEVVRRLEQYAPSEVSRPLSGANSRPASPLPPAPSPSQASSRSSLQDAAPSSRTPSASNLPQGGAAAAGAPRAPSSSAAQRASGSFWQDQAAGQQAEAEPGGGWASFGPPHDSSAAVGASPQPGGASNAAGARPKLYPTVGAPSPPVGEAAEKASWASFNSPTHASRPGAPQPAPAANTTPPPAAPAPHSEGPLSAGFKVLAVSSPFAAGAPPSSGPPLPSGRPQGEAGSANGRPAPQAFNRTPIQPVAFGSGPPSGLAAAPAQAPGSRGCAAEGGSQAQAKPSSQAGPFLPGFPTSSLPASPMHSRNSSRTADTASRVSADDSLAGNQAGGRSDDGLGGLSEAEQLQLRAAQLEEHCRILEQLLEEKTSEVARLREENARQAHELWRQQQRQPQQRMQRIAPPPKPLPNSGGSSSQGQLKVEVQDNAQEGSFWVAFGGSGGLDEAPTPTVIKPQGSGRLGAQSFPPASPLDHLTPPSAGPSPATPLDELLGTQLDLGGGAQQPGQQTAAPEAPPASASSAAPLGSRKGSGSFGLVGSGLEAGQQQSSGGWDRQLPFVEFNPLASGESEPPKPLRRQDPARPTSRSMPNSAQPSPAKPALGLGGDSSSGSLGGALGASPLKSGGSPTKASSNKGHRRHISESGSQRLFGDLNPLG